MFIKMSNIIWCEDIDKQTNKQTNHITSNYTEVLRNYI